ncbi:MAG: hypothetical protein RMJ15_00025 [Nitrososphaerota archaeon]|nr:hypothetical protein [Nitrososphaerota archaeon]
MQVVEMADKKKTSINIDEKLWSEWLVFVVRKYGTSRKVSEALADAIKEYMQKHGG